VVGWQLRKAGGGSGGNDQWWWVWCLGGVWEKRDGGRGRRECTALGKWGKGGEKMT
jgi:hypothetical protein